MINRAYFVTLFLIGQNCVESDQKIVEISYGGKKSIVDGVIVFIIALSLMVRHYNSYVIITMYKARFLFDLPQPFLMVKKVQDLTLM